MADDGDLPAQRRARYKYTGNGDDHPDAVWSEDKKEWVSKTPGGLRVPSKHLPFLEEGEQLEDHLYGAPEPSVRTRQEDEAWRAALLMPSPQRGVSRSKTPSQESSDQEEIDAFSDEASAPEIRPRASLMVKLKIRYDGGRPSRGKGKAPMYAVNEAPQEMMSSDGEEVEEEQEVESEEDDSSPGPKRSKQTARKKVMRYTDDPPRVVTFPSPIPLLMDINMAPYHGSKPIPNAIKNLRNDIKNNFLATDGSVRSTLVCKKYPNGFRTDGKMKLGNAMVEFYMDLRLFSQKTWDLLTLEYRPDDANPGKRKIHIFARLGDETLPNPVEGQLAGDVPMPAGWDYDADL